MTDTPTTMNLFSPSDLPEQKAPRNPNRPDGVAYIYPPALAARLVARAGMPWRPANGFEGDAFEGSVCSECRKQEECLIPMLAMTFGISDREYPREWRIAEAGQPLCTAFAPR